MTAGINLPPPVHHLPLSNPSKINNTDEVRVGKARDQIKKLINRRPPTSSNRESTHIHNSSIESRGKNPESHLARKKTNLDYSMEITRHPATNNLNISQQHSQSLNRSKDDSREIGFEDLKQRVFRKKGHSQVTSVTSKSRGHEAGDMIINTRISTDKHPMNPYITGSKLLQAPPKAKNPLRPPQQTPKSHPTHNSTLSYQLHDDDYRDEPSDASRAPNQKLFKNFNDNLEAYLQQNSTKNRKPAKSNHNKDRSSQPPNRNGSGNYGYDSGGNNNQPYSSNSKNQSLRNSVERNGKKKQGGGGGGGGKGILVSDLFVGSHNFEVRGGKDEFRVKDGTRGFSKEKNLKEKRRQNAGGGGRRGSPVTEGEKIGTRESLSGFAGRDGKSMSIRDSTSVVDIMDLQNHGGVLLNASVKQSTTLYKTESSKSGQNDELNLKGIDTDAYEQDLIEEESHEDTLDDLDRKHSHSPRPISNLAKTPPAPYRRPPNCKEAVLERPPSPCSHPHKNPNAKKFRIESTGQKPSQRPPSKNSYTSPKKPYANQQQQHQ